MKDYEKKFIGFLKTNNLKYTRPRQVILQAAFKNKSHFDVETLYEQIRRKSRDVSRATVYRTMPLLVKSGLIKQSLRCQAKDQYENVTGRDQHLHLVCDECGEIIEIDSREFEAMLISLADKYSFKVHDLNIGARGLCRRCSAEKEN